MFRILIAGASRGARHTLEQRTEIKNPQSTEGM